MLGLRISGISGHKLVWEVVRRLGVVLRRGILGRLLRLLLRCCNNHKSWQAGEIRGVTLGSFNATRRGGEHLHHQGAAQSCNPQPTSSPNLLVSNLQSQQGFQNQHHSNQGASRQQQYQRREHLLGMKAAQSQ